MATSRVSLAATYLPTFRDPALQEQYVRAGYVVIDGFCDRDEMAAMLRAFDLDAHGDASAFSTTPASSNLAYRRRAHEAIVAGFARSARELLAGFRLDAAGFVAKTPSRDGGGALPVHQDPSFTNDAEWPTVRIWMPLCDLTERNGPLAVVPGSHELNRFPRAWGLTSPYPELDDEIRRRGVTLYLRAGQAVLTPPTLFHFSPPNESDATRVAAAAVGLPHDAPLWFVRDEPDEETYAIYAADGDFYQTHDLGTRPKAAPIGRCGKLYEQTDLARLDAVVRSAGAA